MNNHDDRVGTAGRITMLTNTMMPRVLVRLLLMLTATLACVTANLKHDLMNTKHKAGKEAACKTYTVCITAVFCQPSLYAAHVPCISSNKGPGSVHGWKNSQAIFSVLIQPCKARTLHMSSLNQDASLVRPRRKSYNVYAVLHERRSENGQARRKCLCVDVKVPTDHCG